MEMSSVIIREAVESDCPDINRMIRELAAYEQAPDAPKLTDSILRKDGFGEKKFYKALVAVDNFLSGSASYAGYLLHFPVISWTGKVAYMEDFYVAQNYRSNGVGTRLWATMLKEYLRTGSSICRFVVLKCNESGQQYYINRGAEMCNHQLFKLSRKNMIDAVKNETSVKGITVRRLDVDDIPKLELLANNALKHNDNSFSSTVLQASIMYSKSPTSFTTGAFDADGTILAAITYCFAYSPWQGRTLYISNFYVIDNYKNSKVGDQVFQNVLRAGIASQCSRCDFPCAPNDEFHSNFFINNGGVNLTEKEGFIFMQMNNETMEQMINTL